MARLCRGFTAGPSGAVPVGGEQSETTALLRRAAGAAQAEEGSADRRLSNAEGSPAGPSGAVKLGNVDVEKN